MAKKNKVEIPQVPKNNFYKETTEAMENRYIYFGKFAKNYKNVDNVALKKSKADSNRLLNKWVDILRTALKIQQLKEQDLKDAIMEANNLLEENNFLTPNPKSQFGATVNDNMLKYLEALNNLLIDQTVVDSYNGKLFYIIRESFNSVVTNFNWDSEILKLIEDNKQLISTNKISKKINDAFYSKVELEIKKNLEREKVAGYEKIVKDGNIRKILQTFGEVTNVKKVGINEKIRSKKALNQITQKIFYDNVTNKKGQIVEFDVNNFNRQIGGMTGEMIAYLGTILNKQGGSLKVTSTGSEKSSKGQSQKTDLIAEYSEIKIGSKTLKDLKIRFSIKSSNQVVQEVTRKSGKKVAEKYRASVHLQGEASLKTRREDLITSLKNFNITENEINEVFYHINNQIIKTKATKLSKTIMEVIAYTALTWMFDEESINSIQTAGTEDLTFFLIGGKIIPLSLIFELMLEKSKKIKPQEIVRASFIKPPAPMPVFKDYIKNNDLQEDSKNDFYATWNYMRDWVESKGSMAIYLEAEEIFDLLRLEELKS